MRKALLIMALAVTSFTGYGYRYYAPVEEPEPDIETLQSEIEDLQFKNDSLAEELNFQFELIDSLAIEQKKLEAKMYEFSIQVDKDNIETNERIDKKSSMLSHSIHSRTLLAIAGIACAVLLLGLVYWLLRRRIKRGVTVELERMNRAQEQSLEHDLKMVEALLPEMEASVDEETEVPDHAVALKAAGELARIETSLTHIADGAKGIKPLRKALKQLRGALQSKGYEVPALLGEPYDEAIGAEVEYVADDSLSPGETRVSDVLRPQVVHNGETIQTARLVVSRNI